MEEQLDEAGQLSVLREQVLEVAREIGVVLSVSSTGREPTIVTLSDGGKRFFSDDHDRYRSAVQGGRMPPTLSFRRAAPLPVSRWDRPRLEQWLAEHAVLPE